MNFQNLKSIEGPKHYLDVAFRKASKKMDIIRGRVKARDRVTKSRTLEISRMEIVAQSLTNDLDNIMEAFPQVDELDPFYVELIKATLVYKDLKKSLGSVSWASSQVSRLFKIYKSKIKKAELKKINPLRREFYGRVSSVLDQIKPYLFYLEESRKTMKSYPAIKTSIPTVCLFGFPNVGKSTLLTKLTSAEPEIDSYAFTTKRLNLGYIEKPRHRIQIIDTPGTLNRKDKMNLIELQAYLALKYVTDMIVFVFDPTMDHDKQKKLLARAKRYNKPLVVYKSKTDISDQDIGIDSITDINKLEEKIFEITDR